MSTPPALPARRTSVSERKLRSQLSFDFAEKEQGFTMSAIKAHEELQKLKTLHHHATRRRRGSLVRRHEGAREKLSIRLAEKKMSSQKNKIDAELERSIAFMNEAAAKWPEPLTPPLPDRRPRSKGSHVDGPNTKGKKGPGKKRSKKKQKKKVKKGDEDASANDKGGSEDMNNGGDDNEEKAREENAAAQATVPTPPRTPPSIPFRRKRIATTEKESGEKSESGDNNDNNDDDTTAVEDPAVIHNMDEVMDQNESSQRPNSEEEDISMSSSSSFFSSSSYQMESNSTSTFHSTYSRTHIPMRDLEQDPDMHISPPMKLVGAVRWDNLLRVSGLVEGELLGSETATVHITDGGVRIGDITGVCNVVIESGGKMFGSIEAANVAIKGGGVLMGNVFADSMSLDGGAILVGTIEIRTELGGTNLFDKDKEDKYEAGEEDREAEGEGGGGGGGGGGDEAEDKNQNVNEDDIREDKKVDNSLS